MGMLMLGVALDRVPRVRAYTPLSGAPRSPAWASPAHGLAAVVSFALSAAQVRGLDGHFDRAR